MPLLLLSAAALNGGWEISEITRYAGNEEFKNEIFIDTGRYKSKSGDETMIIDMNGRKIYFMYESKKRYWGGKAEAVIGDIFKNSVTEMSGDTSLGYTHINENSTVEIVKTGESITISGFEGIGYQVLVDGELKKEIYIAPKLTANSEIDPKDLSTIMLLLSGVEVASAGVITEISDEYVNLMRQGYPIRTIEYDPSGDPILTEVVKAKQRSFNANEFIPPENFINTKKELEE
ncbi:MAG: hypothetical protein LBE89_01255 [Helicobacteraceae bacterium]|jgi:hypothetical protein|nr:hypothetical protein [Helicobacteraceae bacterium]